MLHGFQKYLHPSLILALFQVIEVVSPFCHPPLLKGLLYRVFTRRA
jgi:hypothetical protein